MCQTVAYLLSEGKEVLLLEDVVSIVPGTDGIRMVNLFGEERTVHGRITQIDLLTHRVIITGEGG
jgi:predicted RNA-binding protein